MKSHVSATRVAGLFAPAILFLVTILSTCACAQTIRVRLLNAKNGKPIAKRYVWIEWKGGFESTGLMTDSSGIASVSIPTGASEFSVMGGGTEKEPYRTAYAVCGDLVANTFLVPAVIKTGVVPGNRCGHASVPSRPGEIVLWGEPRAWWQPDFQ